MDAHVAYGPWISIEALFAAIVGGLGTMFGPLVGAVALLGLGELTKSVSGGVPGVDLLVFGAILILTVAFVPGGLMSLRERVLGRRRPKGETALRSEEGA